MSGAVRKLASGDAATDVKGMLVRPYPTSGNGTDGLGTSTPPTSGICDVLKRGYIFAKLAQAAPTGAEALAAEGPFRPARRSDPPNGHSSFLSSSSSSASSSAAAAAAGATDRS